MATQHWLISEVWNKGFKTHETVIEKDEPGKEDLLLGGAHRTMDDLFVFTPVTCKLVSKACGSEETLTKVVQFTEPLSDEWNTLAQ